MHINKDQFKDYSDDPNPPEHRCAESIAAESTKQFKVRIFIIPIPHKGTWEDQPHIVVSNKDDGNICGINADFCPYCGADLGNWIREKVQEKTIETKPIRREYFEYRKRFITLGHSGKEIAPIRESKWETETKRFESTVRMLNAAREEHKEQLTTDLKELTITLCLSEDYLRNYQLPDETTPNQNDSE